MFPMDIEDFIPSIFMQKPRRLPLRLPLLEAAKCQLKTRTINFTFDVMLSALNPRPRKASSAVCH
ncbi:hypothetical protein ATE71_18430 [Sphingopyxis sp. H115]|nr:hypothetical protein ATE71_18430 [Sphingopyxis sp. H115]